MDLLRGQVADLAASPTATVAALHNELTALQTRIELLDIASLALGLLAGIAGIALFTSGIASRVASNAENARRLGEGQPLQAITYAGDEIGRVAELHLVAEALLARRDAELTAARDAAVKATQAKNTFLSSTSHELRTPLNSILGFGQLLQMSDLSDEDSDGVERILAGRAPSARAHQRAHRHRPDRVGRAQPFSRAGPGPVGHRGDQPADGSDRGRTLDHGSSSHGARPALAVQADRQRLSPDPGQPDLQCRQVQPPGRQHHDLRPGRRTPGRPASWSPTPDRAFSPENLERIFDPLRAPRRRTDRDRGHRDRAAPGQSPHHRHGRPAHRHRASSAGARPSPSASPAPRTWSSTRPPAPHQPHGRPGRTPTPEPASAFSTSRTTRRTSRWSSRFLKGRPNTRLQVRGISGQAGIEYAVRDRPDLILLDLHLPDLHGDQVLSRTQGRTRHRRHSRGSRFRRRLPRRHPPPARRRRARLPHQAHRACRTRRTARHLRHRQKLMTSGAGDRPDPGR